MKDARQTVVIMKELRKMLKEKGLETQDVKVAATGSCYFRFKDDRIGKVRIGDHNERERYGYRWQVRIGQASDFKVDSDKGHKRYFYSSNNLKAMVQHILNYYSVIIRNSGKGD
jgi:hypothetical protein